MQRADSPVPVEPLVRRSRVTRLDPGRPCVAQCPHGGGCVARRAAAESRWAPYSRTVLNTVGGAHTTTNPCPEIASPTRVSGNIGDGCVSPSASLAPANNVRDLPPDHRSSTLRRHSRPCGRTRANALCPDQMLPTSCQSTKKSGTSAIPTRTQKGNGYQSGPLVESLGPTLFSTIPPFWDRTIAFSLVSFLCSLFSLLSLLSSLFSR